MIQSEEYILLHTKNAVNSGHYVLLQFRRTPHALRLDQFFAGKSRRQYQVEIQEAYQLLVKTVIESQSMK